MMRLPLLTIVLALCLAVPPAARAEEPKLETESDKVLYALGFALSQQVAAFDFNEAELSIIKAGLTDAVLRRDARIDLKPFGPKIDSYLRERITRVAEAEKEKGLAFQAKMAEEAGAVKLDSGLIYRELTPGDGPSPSPTDTVKIDYHGTLRDGSVFDSSIEGPNPAPTTFALNRVIPCFSEGVQKMKAGGKSKLTCPPELAYGDGGAPPKIPAGATLVFEVTLLEIVPPPTPAAAPVP